MAGIAVGRGRRGVAREFGGDGHVRPGHQHRLGEFVFDLDAGKRRNTRSISFAVGNFAHGDGGFEIPHDQRHACKILDGNLRFRKQRKKMVRPAIAPRDRPRCFPGACTDSPNSDSRRAGNYAFGFAARKQGGGGCGRSFTQTKTGLRVATGANGFTGFQQRADERARPHVIALAAENMYV